MKRIKYINYRLTHMKGYLVKYSGSVRLYNPIIIIKPVHRKEPFRSSCLNHRLISHIIILEKI